MNKTEIHSAMQKHADEVILNYGFSKLKQTGNFTTTFIFYWINKKPFSLINTCLALLFYPNWKAFLKLNRRFLICIQFQRHWKKTPKIVNNVFIRTRDLYKVLQGVDGRWLKCVEYEEWRSFVHIYQNTFTAHCHQQKIVTNYLLISTPVISSRFCFRRCKYLTLSTVHLIVAIVLFRWILSFTGSLLLWNIYDL